MTFDPVAFATWMRDTRTARGISLRALEAYTGISNNTLSYIELKSKDLTVGNFCAICEALGASPTTQLKRFQK